MRESGTRRPKRSVDSAELVAGDSYELRIATGHKPWKVTQVGSNLDFLKPTLKTEEGLVRVQVKVPAGHSGDWQWVIRFTD